MQMKKWSTCWLLLFSWVVQAQDFQWASRVIGVSSEKVNYQQPSFQKAAQILGRPNVLPQTVLSGLAWMPNGANFDEDWIHVGFVKPQFVQQVVIAENYNAGAIHKIYFYDSQGKETLAYTETGITPKTSGRLWYVPVAKTSFEVASVKIVLDHTRVKGYKQIDAIGIADHQQPLNNVIHLVKDFPVNLEKQNLGKNVNSKYGEVAPIISPDGQTLFYTRINHPDNIDNPARQDIWMSRQLSDNEWTEAENLGKPVNTKDDNAAAAISPDGKTLYVLNVYKPDGSLQLGLSKTVKKRLTWSFPEEVKIDDYYSYSSYTEFSFSPDGKMLILSLHRQDTQGSKDLYVSRANRDGTFSAPINLGTVVNSAGIEGSPFLAADNRTLFFTSDGHAGYGGGDIFLTRRLDESWRNWSEPENLGPAINTPKWDGYFTIPASGEYAYMSSEQMSLGKEDIFRIKLFPSIKPDPVVLLHGSVYKKGTREALPAHLHVVSVNDSTNFTVDIPYDPETGEYKLILPIGKKYEITAKGPDLWQAVETIDTRKEAIYREWKKDIFLSTPEKGQTMILPNVQFDQGEYILRQEAILDLSQVIAWMTENPTMEILLEGHSDNQGDMYLNIELAKNRVQVVKDYICTQGNINPIRIQLKAWGPARPVASNASEGSRKKNRRVELTVLKM